MMEEGEAKNKWCPFARSENCIGAECMAWRFSHPLFYVFDEEKGSSVVKEDIASFTDQGYCGLAGKP
jgi:hypothetical protein